MHLSTQAAYRYMVSRAQVKHGGDQVIIGKGCDQKFSGHRSPLIFLIWADFNSKMNPILTNLNLVHGVPCQKTQNCTAVFASIEAAKCHQDTMSNCGEYLMPQDNSVASIDKPAVKYIYSQLAYVKNFFSAANEIYRNLPDFIWNAG